MYKNSTHTMYMYAVRYTMYMYPVHVHLYNVVVHLYNVVVHVQYRACLHMLHIITSWTASKHKTDNQRSGPELHTKSETRQKIFQLVELTKPQELFPNTIFSTLMNSLELVTLEPYVNGELRPHTAG